MDGDKPCKRGEMGDSGLGSFGSESDTSPGAPTLVKPSESGKKGPKELNTTPSNSTTTHLDSKQGIFMVGYFGSLEIDKRYVLTQFWKVILQWIVAEIKRKFALVPITLDVLSGILKCTKQENNEAVFEHDLHQVSKFSRTHLDTSCFAYVTKKNEFSFMCHVFKTDSENVVLDIFNTIRDATKTKDAIFQSVTKHMSESIASDQQQHASVSLFEVLYIGKVVVSSKKTQPTFIDDAVEKFKLYEEQKEKEAIERTRRSSGQSVQSLPGNLDRSVSIKEDELKLTLPDNSISHSNDSISSTGSDPNMSVSSSDTMPNDTSVSEQSYFCVAMSNSEDSINESTQDLHVDGQVEFKATRTAETLQRTVLVNQTQGKKNRTMLLQISKNEVCLISPDRKRTSLRRNFKDISFCSQGICHPEYFGFITRDADGVSFVCYVFMCAAESVVEEVMQTLKLAFEAAFQQSAKTHMCELCPMHQLQKVCEEIHKLSWDQVVEILTRHVDQLCDTDRDEFHKKVTTLMQASYIQAEEHGSVQEMAEVFMMVLRHLCEDRQVDHVHISDTKKNLVNRYEFTLIDSAKNRHSKFDDLKIRAKKSLADSFVNLKERVRHKSGEAMRDLFRDRSWSVDSESNDQESTTGGFVTSPTNAIKGFLFNIPTSPNTTADTPQLHVDIYRPRCNTNPVIQPNILQQMRDTYQPIHSHNSELQKTHSAHAFGDREVLTLDKLAEETKEPMKPAKNYYVGAKGDGVQNERPEKRSKETDDDAGRNLRKEMQQYDSPLKTMFMQASNSNKSMKTPSPLFAKNSSTKSPFTKPPLKRAGSWRLNILTKVVTPAKMPTRSQSCQEPPTYDENEELFTSSMSEKALDKKASSQKYRMLWKKAILETLLFIRMKKEMNGIKTRQDEAGSSPHKLDYEEITPCLKQVTKIWTEMLSAPNRKSHKYDVTNVEEAVKDGVPRAKRGEIWQLLVEQHKLRHPTLHNMPEIHLPYEDLLKQLTTHQHAILIDLGRTFPGHPYFSTQLGAGQLSLFNILKAYSLLDKEVGYCQGLSFVAGILLMHMPESVTFELMRYLMFSLGFRGQYRPDMVALQIQMYQLSRLLHDKHRDLYDHFEEHDITPTLYAAPWFLTMFASQFPLGFVARVFDVIFLQGSMEVVLKVAFVVLGNHKELIKNCTTFESVVDFLKTDLPEMGIIQMERVFNQVFSLDISKQLHAYEVEYHVLQEEMVTTPQRGETDVVSKLEDANHNLKRTNLELLEKLQATHSQNRSLNVQMHGLQTSNSKLKHHIRTLEIERAALLDTMSRIQTVVSTDMLEEAGIVVPAIPRNMTITNSPIHNPVGNISSTPLLMSSLDNEVACLMDEMSHNEPTQPASKPLRPPRRTRRPSSSDK